MNVGPRHITFEKCVGVPYGRRRMPAAPNAAWRLRVLLTLLVTGLLGLFGGASPASARMRLVAKSGETGWVQLSVTGAPGSTVELIEREDGRDVPLAALAPANGAVTLEHAAKWRCARRLRHFRARSVTPGGTEELAPAAIRTPPCRNRLRVILPSREVRPGQSVGLRVTDGWGLGGLRTRLCVGRVKTRPRCRALDLSVGRPHETLRIPLNQGGRWLFTVSLRHGARVTRTVKVGPAGGLRVLVTGDSMTFGIPQQLRPLLTPQNATVVQDTKPGTGLTKPQFVNWADHAYVIAHAVQPDVSFVMLGAARDALPLKAPDGTVVQCCDQSWVDAYAGLVERMVSRLLRRGRALVYYGLLPAPLVTPEAPRRAIEWAAVNQAVRQAAASFPDGVVAMDGIYQALTPDGIFHETLTFDGVEKTVRKPDGIHLDTDGEIIAASIIERQLRADGLI